MYLVYKSVWRYSALQIYRQHLLFLEQMNRKSYKLYRLQARAAIILLPYSEYQYKAYKYSDIPGMCRGACQESQCECIEYVRKSDNTHVFRHVNVPPII